MSEVVCHVPTNGEMLAILFDELPGTMLLSEFLELYPAFQRAVVHGFEQGIAHQNTEAPKGQP